MNTRVLIIAIIGLAVFESCSDKECAQENEKLTLQIEEYKKRETVFSEAMADYDKSVNEYKAKDDTLKMYRDSVVTLVTKMNKIGYASRKDNKAIKKYMNQIKKVIAENKKIADYLKQHVNENDLGKNPAIAIEFLVQNIESKEKEIIAIQNEINDLRSKVKGLKYKVEKIESENSELIKKSNSLDEENKEITDKAKQFVLVNTKLNFYNKRNKKFGNKISKKRLKYIESCFIIAKNDLITKRHYTFYMQVIKNQTILSHNQSNLFIRKSDKKRIGYTQLELIEYTGKNTNACIKWDIKNIKMSGSYTIEIFDGNGKKLISKYFKI